MNHDERGSENVSELKGNLRKFKLYLVFWSRFICQLQLNFPGVEFLRTVFKFKRRKGNLSSCDHVHVIE